MKLKLKIGSTFLLSVLMLALGCKKVDFGDMNVDPNRTTSPITPALLTQSLSNLQNTVWDQGGVRTIAGLYAQYFTETQYTEASRYSKPTSNWDGYYSGVLYDLQNIINYNTDAATKAKAAEGQNGSNNNQIAVARILKAYYYWWLTDVWGDIPYTAALKAVTDIPYDKQENIYPSLLTELKGAIAQFDNGLPASGDILYNGNISKWKKFANSLRMLIALQMSKANATLGKTEFAAALADAAGSIADNADNATLTPPGGNFQNIFYNYYNVVQRDDYAVAKTLMDTLSTYGDKRLTVVGTSTVGFPYGLTRDAAVAFANANTNYARPLGYAADNDPVVIVGAANVLLARAEAAQLGWTTENVAALYAAGIEQSWRQWGVYDAASLATYLANPKVSLATEPLKKIAIQEWLAWYPNGIRGWSVWRRTGYPALAPPPGVTAAIPRRFPYGPNEPQLNPKNYAPAAASYTANGEENSQWARVWWDK